MKHFQKLTFKILVFLIVLGGPASEQSPALTFQAGWRNWEDPNSELGAISVRNNRAYLIERKIKYNQKYEKNFNLIVLDLNNPLAPRQIGKINIKEENPDWIMSRGNYAFIGVKKAVILIDTSDPKTMYMKKRLPVQRTYRKPILYKDHAYLYGDKKLAIIDLREPGKPRLRGEQPAPESYDSVIYQNYIYYYVAEQTPQGYGQFFYIYNLRNPTRPKFAKKVPAKTCCVTGMAVRDEYLYLSDLEIRNLQVVSLKNPLQPRYIKTYEQTGVNQIFIHGKTLFAVNSYSKTPLQKYGLGSNGEIQKKDSYTLKNHSRGEIHFAHYREYALLSRGRIGLIILR